MGKSPALFRVRTCPDDERRVETCPDDRFRVRGCGGREVAADLLMCRVEINPAVCCDAFAQDTVCGTQLSGNLAAIEETLGADLTFAGGPNPLVCIAPAPCGEHLSLCDQMLYSTCRAEGGSDQVTCFLHYTGFSQNAPFCLYARGEFAGGRLIAINWTGSANVWMPKTLGVGYGPPFDTVLTLRDCCPPGTNDFRFQSDSTYFQHPNNFYNVDVAGDPCNNWNSVLGVGSVEVVATLRNPAGLPEPFSYLDWFDPPPGSAQSLRLSASLNWNATGFAEVPWGQWGVASAAMSGFGGQCVGAGGAWQFDKQISGGITPMRIVCSPHENPCLNERVINCDDPPPPIDYEFSGLVRQALVRIL